MCSAEALLGMTAAADFVRSDSVASELVKLSWGAALTFKAEPAFRSKCEIPIRSSRAISGLATQEHAEYAQSRRVLLMAASPNEWQS
jgi:hypothetical protein